MKVFFGSKSAHTVAEWAILFALVPVVFFVVQGYLRRTIAAKTFNLADYVFWTQQTGQQRQQHFKDTNIQDKAKTTSDEYAYFKERDGIVRANADDEANPNDLLHSHTNTTTRQASIAVEQGAEPLFNDTNLNTQYGLDGFFK